MKCLAYYIDRHKHTYLNMETILSKIIDTEKLSNYVKSSLGDLDKLRKVSNALRNNPSLCSVLEDELIDRLDEFYTKSTQKDHGQYQEYLHWVCCIIDRLSVKKWSNRSETLWAAVCVSFFANLVFSVLSYHIFYMNKITELAVLSYL